MTTYRKWLDELGFDWKTGILIHQTKDGKHTWSEYYEFTSAHILSHDDPVLDLEFYDGFGLYECPRIIAKDDEAIYISSDYDGRSRLHKIFLAVSAYLDFKKNPIPHLGGGG